MSQRELGQGLFVTIPFINVQGLAQVATDRRFPLPFPTTHRHSCSGAPWGGKLMSRSA